MYSTQKEFIVASELDYLSDYGIIQYLLYFDEIFGSQRGF